MGRQAFLAALSWLSVGGTLAVNSFVFRDNQSAGSAPRLYRQVPGAVYASGAPYASYSFQIPTVVAQKAAASRVVPVKETSVFQNANGYLKDSYGNRFVEALQSMRSIPFKPFPQQYVQLQELPAHFAQPLAAAPTSFEQKQAPSQIVIGSHYRLPQSAAPTPIHQYNFGRPGVYADSYKSLAPTSFLSSFGSHFGPVVQSPSHSSAAAYESAHKNSPPNRDYSHSVSHKQEQPHAEQHSTSSKPTEAAGDHKFQKLQETPRESYIEEEPRAATRKVVQKEKAKLQAAPLQHSISTVVNGKKTIVNVQTKPPIPLLDINLLEPLTFDNPLVPQVQHFLPRIHDATYHRLPEFKPNENKKKTKTKKVSTKTKQKKPEIVVTYDDDYIPQATARPVVTVLESDDGPEISYEINEPNYKETYKEKAIKYNKETQSEPVHYTYGSKTNPKPVHYAYTHSSKEPLQIQAEHYEGKGKGPKQLIYKFKPEEQDEEKLNTESEDSNESSELSEDDERPHHGTHQEYHSTKGSNPNNEDAEHREQEYHHKPSPNVHHNVQHNVHPSSSQGPEHREQEHHHSPRPNAHHKVQHNIHSSDNHGPEHREQQYNHNPRPSAHHNVQHNIHLSDIKEPEHREQEHHHNSRPKAHHKVQHNIHSSDIQEPEHRELEHHHNPRPNAHHKVQHNTHSSDDEGPVQHYPLEDIPSQPVAQYEEDISLTAPIKVDPNQHVQQPHSKPQQAPASPAPQQHSHHTHSPQKSKAESKPHHQPPPTHVHEKTKQVYIQEEVPEDDESVGEQLMKAVFGKESEDREQDFENDYKNAAFGFPAYDKPSGDVEKSIYSPETYGATREHDYVIDHAPFQQYQEQGDHFPKAVRLSYKDDREKTKDDYFSEYSISRPESLADRQNNKAQYYKLYKDQTPEKYVAHEYDNKNKEKKSEKLTAIPYSYYSVPDQKPKQFFAQYKVLPFASAPLVFEYDYSKGTPKDNSAHASRPFLRYKKTNFVEPQFQYGFEPLAIPRLLDSELAAMASSNSPENEKPGTRKKIYKENFYIKQTSMSDKGPNS